MTRRFTVLLPNPTIEPPSLAQFASVPRGAVGRSLALGMAAQVAIVLAVLPVLFLIPAAVPRPTVQAAASTVWLPSVPSTGASPRPPLSRARAARPAQPPRPRQQPAVATPPADAGAPAAEKPEHERNQDFRKDIPYLVGIYLNRRVPATAELLFEANSGDYLRALALLNVVIALTPYDIDVTHRALVWQPATRKWKFDVPLPPQSVTRELADPRQISALRDAVRDAADMFRVKPEEIRGFAVYEFATWQALCGRALLARQEKGKDANAPALLRYHVDGTQIRVEVEE